MPQPTIRRAGLVVAALAVFAGGCTTPDRTPVAAPETTATAVTGAGAGPPAGQRRVPVTFSYAAESDPGPYPIPPDAAIEGGPRGDGDRHVIVWDRAACRPAAYLTG